jgi:erythromycin esterase-like protein
MVENSDEDIQVTFYLTDADEMNWVTEFLDSQFFGNEAASIGFTTYDSTVTVASDWDGPAERKNVRPSHRESYEALFTKSTFQTSFSDFETTPMSQRRCVMNGSNASSA